MTNFDKLETRYQSFCVFVDELQPKIQRRQRVGTTILVAPSVDCE